MAHPIQTPITYLGHPFSNSQVVNGQANQPPTRSYDRFTVQFQTRKPPSETSLEQLAQHINKACRRSLVDLQNSYSQRTKQRIEHVLRYDFPDRTSLDVSLLFSVEQLSYDPERREIQARVSLQPSRLTQKREKLQYLPCYRSEIPQPFFKPNDFGPGHIFSEIAVTATSFKDLVSPLLLGNLQFSLHSLHHDLRRDLKLPGHEGMRKFRHPFDAAYTLGSQIEEVIREQIPSLVEKYETSLIYQRTQYTLASRKLDRLIFCVENLYYDPAGDKTRGSGVLVAYIPIVIQKSGFRLR